MITKEEIYAKLKTYGIVEEIKIDDGAEELILNALNQEDIDKVFIDAEGALVIEYHGDTYE
jgi:hypothetical protein